MLPFPFASMRSRSRPFFSQVASSRMAFKALACLPTMKARPKNVKPDLATAAVSEASLYPMMEQGMDEEYQVEVDEGVFITFVPLSNLAGNVIKRIRFDKDFFDLERARQWWDDNNIRIISLYFVPTSECNRYTSVMSNLCTSIEDGMKNKDADCLEPKKIQCNVQGMSLIMGNDKLREVSSDLQDASHQLSATTLSQEMTCLESKKPNIIDDKIHNTVKPKPSCMTAADSQTGVRHFDAQEYINEEWVAEVGDEEGDEVLITFVSLEGGGNLIKKVQFSEAEFDEERARQWWNENYGRIMSLFSVKDYTKFYVENGSDDGDSPINCLSTNSDEDETE